MEEESGFHNIFFIGFVVLLFLFSLFTPPLLYVMHIRAYSSVGMHIHVLIITSVIACFIYWAITFLVFAILSIPLLIIFSGSPKKGKALFWAFIASCVIAMALWLPNICQF